MKKPPLALISTMFLLLSSLSVTALFGRVADFGTYHHICFYLNDITYNFKIDHTKADSWPCGAINTTDDIIRLECISYYDGAHLGKHVPCKGGTSCGRFSFDASKATGVHTNSESPSWEPIGLFDGTTTLSGYPYSQYLTESFQAAHSPVPHSFYTGGTCPSAVIKSPSPANGSTSTSKINTISLTTDLSSTCRYSAIPGTDFSNMEFFAVTDSTSHSFSFTATEDNINNTFYIKCNTSDWGVSEGDYILQFLVDYNNPPNITSIPILNGTEAELYGYNVTATDADGDMLSFSDNTTLFDINATNGSIKFTPIIGGNYTIKITVSDGIETSNQIYNLSIQIVNNAPIIDTISNSTATVNQVFTKLITASDQDGDGIIFSDNSDLFDINSKTGLINFTPSINGTYNFTITVKDNNTINQKNSTQLGWIAITQASPNSENANNTFNLTITMHSLLNNSVVNTSSFRLNLSTDGYAVCKYSLDTAAYNFLDRKVIGSGEAWKVGTSTKMLEISENLNSGSNVEILRNITTFIDDSELSTLASGTASNSKGDAPYNQYMYLLGPGSRVNTGYVVYAEDDADVTADFLYFRAGYEIGRYLLEFTSPLESDVEDSSGSLASDGMYLGDFNDVNLNMFEKQYTIVSANRLSTSGNSIKLTLMTDTVKDTLLEGAAKTYTLAGKDYKVTLDYADSDSVKFTLNSSATPDMKIGGSYGLADRTFIIVSKIIYQDYAGGVHSATFHLGKEKTELSDSNIKDVNSNINLNIDDETIDNAWTIIEGRDNNVTFKLDRIHINMTADDNFYVPAGGKLSQNPDLTEPQVLFTTNWDIEYKGLKEEQLETIEIETSGNKKYKLKFNDGDGNSVDLPLAEAIAASSPVFGEKDKKLVNIENKTIVKDDYLILTDSSKSRGDRKTYVLQYKGADKSTADNPKLKFKNLGSGETIEQTYTATASPLATLKIGGADYRVFNATQETTNDLGANDFKVVVDLDASGAINRNGTGVGDTNQKTINITTQYGMEIGIQNSSNGDTGGTNSGILVSFKTPDNTRDGSSTEDRVETLQATDFVVNITANSDTKVAMAVSSGHTGGQGGTKLTTRTPDGETNVAYAYTSYGAFITHRTPLNEPATLRINYPKNQREALVYITAQQTKNSYEKTLNNLGDGSHSIDITCKDSLGKEFNSYFKFTVAASNLNVESNFPANASVNVSVKENIKANFSQGIGKYHSKGIIVKELSGERAKGMLYYNSTINQLVLDPILLKYNTTYLVSINKNIKGLTGNTLGQDYFWNFTTAHKDTDNDGIFDDEDNDLDNDNIDDNLDALRGNLSNINSNFNNLSMEIGGDKNMSKQFNETKKVKFYFGGKKLLEFDYDFGSASKLDLNNLSILNASNSTLGGIVISGISLPDNSFTKTAYMEKVDGGINGICIKDEEIDWIDNITDSCSGVNEFKVECDGSSQNGYICTYNSSSNLYTINGLKHSGAKQLAYAKPSSGDSSSNDGGGGSGGGSGGGGGGGGGSGAFYVCNMDWSCSEWSKCENGWETRECSFVKVSQHTSNESCASIGNIPQRAKKCEVVQKLDEVKDEETGEVKSNATKKANETKAPRITGEAISDVGEPNKKVGIIITAIVLALGGFLYYGRFKSTS